MRPTWSLLDDLSSRHVPSDDVAARAELAWWQSALERMLQTNQALLSANTSVIERLEADFRLVDDAHAGANGTLLASSLADSWRVSVLDNRARRRSRFVRRSAADTFRQLLLVRHAPNLLGVLAPVWTMSPYEVAQLPDTMRFDTVLLVDAGATTLVENLGAIRRGTSGCRVRRHDDADTLSVRNVGGGFRIRPGC